MRTSLGLSLLVAIAGSASAEPRCLSLADCQKRCESGAGNDCERWAEFYREGWGVPENDARADEIVKRGCDGGGWRACERAGDAELRKRAATLRSSACDAGDGKACGVQGANIDDPKEKERWHEKGCRAGNGKACAGWAFLHAADARQFELHKKAQDVFAAGCAAGDPEACSDAATMTLNPAKTKQLQLTAMKLFADQCERGWPPACSSAAFIATDAKEGTLDLALAKRMHARAVVIAGKKWADRAVARAPRKSAY